VSFYTWVIWNFCHFLWTYISYKLVGNFIQPTYKSDMYHLNVFFINSIKKACEKHILLKQHVFLTCQWTHINLICGLYEISYSFVKVFNDLTFYSYIVSRHFNPFYKSPVPLPDYKAITHSIRYSMWTCLYTKWYKLQVKLTIKNRLNCKRNGCPKTYIYMHD
jgi:hypothetical protein